MVRWLQPRCCHSNQAACQTPVRSRPSILALKLQFPECKVPGAMRETHLLDGYLVRGFQLGRGHIWATPEKVSTEWGGGAESKAYFWGRPGNQPLLKVIHWIFQKEANSYRKVQSLGMGTSPGFSTSLWCCLKLSFKNHLLLLISTSTFVV